MAVRIMLTVSTLTLILIAGCGGAADVTPTTRTVVSEELDGAPEWVLMGGDGDSKTLSAVGSFGGTNNVALARSSAIGRARTELSFQLTTVVKGMLKDYQSTTTGGSAFGEAANDEQFVEMTSKQVTENAMVGSRQSAMWISKTGTLYAMVTLDVDAFDDTIKKMGQLSEDVRRAVTERAEQAFAELDNQ